MNLRRRLDALEADAGAGDFEIVGMGRFDWSAADLDKAEAEARARLGPRAHILRIEYVSDWRRRRKRIGDEEAERVSTTTSGAFSQEASASHRGDATRGARARRRPGTRERD